MSKEKEHKKMGRPIKGKEPRNKQITIRLSSGEMDLLEYCSNKRKIHRTDAIIEGLELLKNKINN